MYYTIYNREEFNVAAMIESKQHTNRDGSIVYVPASTVIGDGVTIGPRGKIWNNVTIGNNVIIYDGVMIENGVTIGDNSAIFSNVNLEKRVTIGDDSLIGRGATIGTATTIGHNVQVGDGRSSNSLAGNGIVVGSRTTIGDNSTIAQLAKIGNKVEIGPHCAISVRSIVRDDVHLPEYSLIPNHSIVSPGADGSPVVIQI